PSRKGRVGLCATIFFIGEKPQKKDFRCYPSRGAAHQHISIQNFDPAISKNKQIHFFLIYQIRVICVANHKLQMQ
ncbi:hypothetical protein LIS90_13975, partial [Flavobacterium psychrophilum]|uniref:hypothetical protein n=1 Tax=Flavobacterium psychrophilum TaxID=96345 RepID=UPI001D07A7C9